MARAAQVADRVELRAQEAVGGELEHECNALGRVGGAELGERRFEPRVRLGVATQQALHPREPDRETRTQHLVVAGHARLALDQRHAALVEAAAGCERLRVRQHQRDPLLGRSCRREQPERSRVPARSARGRALRGRVARLAERRDCREVAVASGALDVMGTCRRGGAALVERLRAALVRAQPPAAGRRLVHGAPDQRVAEAEAPRHVGLAHEVEAQQLVERSERGRIVVPAAAAASSGSNGSPATAAPSSTRRATVDSISSSSARAAATLRGTCTPPSESLAAVACAGPAWSCIRASCSR